MSRAPYSLPKAETGFPFGNLTAYDTALGWRYPNPHMQEMYGTESMGETAENIAAERPHLTRQLQDEFSLRSHQPRRRRHRLGQIRRGDPAGAPSRRKKARRRWWTRTSAPAATPAWKAWAG